ncbi:MAG TPA: NUMOD3 domain-containing DNA-binding protein [Trebonia sp.]|nr:NUMOD3 domain-containing DNA-binding protein [Trebonia sp.]
MSNRTHDPIVYYGRRDGLIKIGTTTNARTRLSAQGIEELLAVEPGSYDLETQRHEQFAEHRLSRRRGTGNGRGSGPVEWFRPGADLLAHIEVLRAVYVLPKLRSWVPPPADGRYPTGSQEYNNLHHRMKHARGSASLQQCVKCGESAAHWARLHETDGMDIWNDYVPMCIKCHRAYDLGGRPMSAEHREQLSQYALNERTDEHLRKISEALKGRSDIGMAGKHHSEETRRKMREAQPNFGKKTGPMPAEIRQRISATMRGRPRPPGVTEKILRTKARLRAEKQGDTLF